MMQESSFESFYAHDVTIKIDELIQNGQAQKMNMTNIKEIMDTLINTQAVRTGDYLNNKERYYMDETLPQLPFFLNSAKDNLKKRLQFSR